MQTPDTTGYMILGFVVIFGVLALHLASFVVRQRSLTADLQALQYSGRKPAKKKSKTKAKPKRKKR